MKSFINVLLIILILFALLYFNVLEAYTPDPTTLAANTTTSATNSNSTSSCKRGNREQQPIHNIVNNSNTTNQYLVGNNIKGFL